MADRTFSVAEAITLWAAHEGSRLALSGPDGQLTYAELEHAASCFAALLPEPDSGSARVVGLLFDNEIARVVASLGVLKAGHAYMPIDIALDDRRIGELLAACECTILATSSALIDRARALAGATLQVVELPRAPAGASTAPRVAPARPERLAYIRLTSGSTGLPKGVIHDHRTALALARAFATTVDVGPEDRVTLFNPFWHTLIFGTLISGASLHLFDLRRQGLRELGAWLAAEQISVFSSFPTAFRQLAASLDERHGFPDLRRISLSGERLTAEDVALVRRHFGAGCVLVNNYGSSELGHIASHQISVDDPISAAGVPVGRAVPGVEIVLLDSERRPVGAGEDGEIAVRSAFLTGGYRRDPERAAASYVRDASGSGRMLLTGDVGRFDGDGLLHVIGRTDRQVKTRGHRVQPDEVEAVLAGHAAVSAVAVAPFPAAGGDVRLAAYIVPKGVRPTGAELRNFCVERLPGHMVPMRFVVLDRLPLSSSGKVDWRALALPPRERDDGETTPALTDLHEREFAELWRELLQIDQVRRDDDFFDLGGDSLLAAQMTARAEAIARTPIALTTIAEAPTLREFAARVHAAAGASPPTIDSFNLGGSERPLFFLHPEYRGCTYDRRLADHLGRQQPLISIAPPGQPGEDTVPATIEGIAARRLAKLREAQPSGPYSISGFCNGATIAWEIARQLIIAGERVDVVILIDPRSSNILPRFARRMVPLLYGVATRRRRSEIMSLANHLDAWRASSAQRGIAALRWLGHLRSRRGEIAGAQPKPHPRPGPPPESALLQHAVDNYVPRPLATRLVVLSSAHGERADYAPERWRVLQPDATLERIPGDHLGCLTRHAGALASRIASHLRGSGADLQRPGGFE